jgi:hypothetical protein
MMALPLSGRWSEPAEAKMNCGFCIGGVSALQQMHRPNFGVCPLIHAIVIANAGCSARNASGGLGKIGAISARA